MHTCGSGASRSLCIVTTTTTTAVITTVINNDKNIFFFPRARTSRGPPTEQSKPRPPCAGSTPRWDVSGTCVIPLAGPNGPALETLPGYTGLHAPLRSAPDLFAWYPASAKPKFGNPKRRLRRRPTILPTCVDELTHPDPTGFEPARRLRTSRPLQA